MEFDAVKEIQELYKEYDEAMEQGDICHASIIHQTITAIENIFDEEILNNKGDFICQ